MGFIEFLMELFYIYTKAIMIFIIISGLIGCFVFIYGKFFQDGSLEKASVPVLILTFGMILITVYAKHYIEERPVINLEAINSQYKGKKVKVDNEIKEISSIEYSEVRNIDIKYKPVYKLSEKKTSVMQGEDFFMSIFILMGLVFSLLVILDKSRRS